MRTCMKAWLLALVLCSSAGLYAGEPEVNLIAMGDWGRGNAEQKAVAEGMAVYAAAMQKEHPIDAVLLLGDNFYTKLPGDEKSEEWKTVFEDVYDAKRLSMPFYVALGNHDYEAMKSEAEMKYAKEHPDSRWKMPAKWYRVDLPKEKPLVTLLCVDTHPVNVNTELGPEQRQWLEGELKKERGAWTIVYGHHPLYSDGRHGDYEPLKKFFGELYAKYKVEFYLAGHDHDLEHLQIKDLPTSFIVSGAGGGALYDLTEPAKRRGFGRKQLGFVGLTLTADLATVRFLDEKGQELYVFTRDKKGEIKVVKEPAPEPPAPAKDPAPAKQSDVPGKDAPAPTPAPTAAP